MTICSCDLLFFITAMHVPNLGIQPLEDGLFVNLLIFDNLCIYIYLGALLLFLYSSLLYHTLLYSSSLLTFPHSLLSFTRLLFRFY